MNHTPEHLVQPVAGSVSAQARQQNGGGGGQGPQSLEPTYNVVGLEGLASLAAHAVQDLGQPEAVQGKQQQPGAPVQPQPCQLQITS